MELATQQERNSATNNRTAQKSCPEFGRHSYVKCMDDGILTGPGTCSKEPMTKGRQAGPTSHARQIRQERDSPITETMSTT
eukprot:scaffold39178_cov220-Skeletonema_marinoi.AAC.11